MINFLKNLFKKQKDLVETKSKVDCLEMKSKNTYGLKQDDIDFSIIYMDWIKMKKW